MDAGDGEGAFTGLERVSAPKGSVIVWEGAHAPAGEYRKYRRDGMLSCVPPFGFRFFARSSVDCEAQNVFVCMRAEGRGPWDEYGLVRA